MASSSLQNTSTFLLSDTLTGHATHCHGPAIIHRSRDYRLDSVDALDPIDAEDPVDSAV